MRARRTQDLRHAARRGALVLALAASAIVVADARGGIRAGIVLLFLAFGPGGAVLGLLPACDVAMTVTLAVSLSVVVDTLVAQGMVWLGAWDPAAGVLVLASITLIFIFVPPRLSQMRAGEILAARVRSLR